MKIKLFTTLVFFAMLGLVYTASGQTTIYATDFGSVANVNPTGWTFTGIGMNISTNNPSSGYTGASGGACLGEGNSVTFTNTAGTSQASSPTGNSEAILQVNTTGSSTVTLSFGMRKSSASYNTNATYTLAWSTDNITYNTITYTEPAAGSWGLVTGSGLTLPAGAGNQPSLYIKWSFARTGTGSNYKLDDVLLTGNAVSSTPSTISFVSGDTTLVESAGSANVFLKLTATSTASSAISVSVSLLSNAGVTDYTLANTTVTFAANAAANSTAAVVINISDDAIAESAEYVVLRLSNPQNSAAGTISQFVFYIADNDKLVPVPSGALSLNLLTSFSNSITGANSAEIVVHDPTTQRLYIANSIGAKLDIVDFVNPSNPVLLYSIPISTLGNINCVAVKNGIVAAAIENSNPQDSGKVVFFNQDGVVLKQVKVGMMPDMITFNHAGTKVLTANEGEPDASYANDPDGSVSIVDISGGIAGLTQANVSHVTFTVYNGQEATLRSQGIRIFGLNASASKDFEPEYISVAKDDSKAWVTLQENNAIVEINLSNNSISYLKSLGTKDHSLLNNGFDASNVTKGVNISNFRIKGMYMPDAIASYTVGGINYLVTANEGDSRAYAGFSEEQRISGVVLDPAKFPNAPEMKSNSFLGRLNITDKTGDIDGDGDLDTLYSYGARSFSIWNATTGNLVYDSKDDFEMITATNSFSVMFNVSNTNTTKKDRSDDKGPEPEGVTIGTIGANTYAFIAIERIGGVMVYDITNPNAPVYVTYVNNRSLPSGGPDKGAEGIIFIPQSESPNGQHLVIAANEVSSTLSIWGIAGCATPLSSALTAAGTTSNACANTPPVLSVPASGTVTYQWSNNGSAVAGATLSSISPTVSGNYSVTISGGSNCSTRSLAKAVSIIPVPTLAVTGNTATCAGAAVSQTISGASTYSWSSGATTSVVSLAPASTTVYTITGTGSNSCTNVINKTITVNALPALTISATSSVLCAGQSATLTASGASTYSWSNTSATAAITVTPSGSTSYTVTGTSTANCSSSLTQSVTVNALPVLIVSATSSVLCAGQSATLTASGASTYSWSNTSAAAVTTVTPAGSTSYTVTGTNTANCSASLVQSVTVNANPTLAISGSTVICAGRITTLTASGAATYSWSNASATAATTLSPASSTSYTVTGTSTANCSSTLVQSITVNANPTLSVAGNTVVCIGTPLSQTVTGASTYTWSPAVAGTGSVVNISPTSATVYTISGTANGCVSSITQSVTPRLAPDLSISGPSVSCAGAPVTQTVSGAATYTWNTGAATAVVTLTPAGATSYTVTGTSVFGCNSTVVKTIGISALPVLTAGSSSSVICAGQSASLTVTGAPAYAWSNGSTANTIAVSPAATTVYTVVGTNADNCSAAVQITQTVSDCTSLKEQSQLNSEFVLYPNPSSSQIHIDVTGAADYHVTIINALGQSVLNVNNYQANAAIDISQMPKGVYFVEVMVGRNASIKKLIIE